MKRFWIRSLAVLSLSGLAAMLTTLAVPPQALLAESLRERVGPTTAEVSVAADTFLDSTNKNRPQGALNQLELDKHGKSRPLVRFETSAIADALREARLISATLRVHVNRVGNSGPGSVRASGPNIDPFPVALHRVTENWTEAAATWHCAIDTSPTDNNPNCAQRWDGGSFVPAATATQIFNGATAGWVSFDVTTDVSAFLNGSANFGWLLWEPDQNHGEIVALSSREAGDGHAPQLVLTFADEKAPRLTVTAPVEDPVRLDPTPEIHLSYTDGFGVDLTTLRVVVAGTEITTRCAISAGDATCEPPPLAPGSIEVEAEIRDTSGNRATAGKSFELILDTEIPTITIVHPADRAVVGGSDLVVSGTVSDDGPIASVTVNGVPATLSGNQFAATVPLVVLGSNAIEAEVVDATGKFNNASAIVFLDRDAPVVFVDEPVDGARVNADSILVSGRVEDQYGVASVDVAGVSADLIDGAYQAVVPVAEGANHFVVTAVDRGGNPGTADVDVSRFIAPNINITSPADLRVVNGSTITVEGTISSPDLAVTVAGVTASVSGTSFVAAAVPIAPGGNLITALATSPSGAQASAKITVFVDNVAPHLAIDEPLDGAVVYEPAVQVTGLINDVVLGTVNSGQATVTVNGRPATVMNRCFLATGVPLVPGENVLTVVGRDAAGNERTATARITFETPDRPVLRLVSGNLQTGIIGTALAAPLVVRVTDQSGIPLAGKPVVFRVLDNNGTVTGGLRQQVDFTDADGRAQTVFTLGSRAGVGNQRVEASSAGTLGRPVFIASALPTAPSRIVVDRGDQQIGATGQGLPDPLVAVVTDDSHNRLDGVPVTFRVVKGRATFADGTTEMTVESDTDGRVATELSLGPDPGVANTVVEALIEGFAQSPIASFTATAIAAGDPALTAISGQVLDNTNLPVPGVTLHLHGTSLTTTSDADGLFRLTGVPVGTFLLKVDGSTTSRPGVWPPLEFVMTTIAGHENILPMPIFLLPIDVGRGVFVSETEGGVISLPEVPGLTLEVAPGSVTFPDGSRSGVVSVTLVHSDHIPMPPNFGQQPRIIVTIQPANAHFDPPARFTLPNVDGLAPGEVTEMYSFDHDLGSFVSIGPATVSDDGAVLVSNPGVGIVKAGWHCGGNPSSSGTPHDCPECQQCINNRCAPTSGSCDDQNECTANDRCENGSCTGDPRRILRVDAKGDGEDDVTTGVEKVVNFSAEVEQENCDNVTYDWNFGDGATGSGQSVTHAYAEEGEYTVTLEVGCEPCTNASRSLLHRQGDNVPVTVQMLEVNIEEPTQGDTFDLQADPPQMPEVMARAVITGFDPDPTAQATFNWTSDLKLDARRCPHGVAGRDYTHPTVTETSTGGEYTLRMTEITTGDLKMKVEVTWENQTDDDMEEKIEIRGTNPPNGSIRNQFPHDTLGRIACQESRFRQFNAGAGGGMSKCPLFSADNLGGVGIMQITNPAPARDEHFDYRANAARGVAIFNQKQPGARNYPTNLQNSTGFRNLVTRLNQARAAQTPPLQPLTVTVPAFTTGDFNSNLQQFELDVIRAYNGYGGPRFLGLLLHEWRLVLDGNGNLVLDNVNEQALTASARWEQVPVAARGTFGDPNYVNNVLGRSPTCQ